MDTEIDQESLLKRATVNKVPRNGLAIITHLSKEEVGRFKSDKEKALFQIK